MKQQKLGIESVGLFTLHHVLCFHLSASSLLRLLSPRASNEELWMDNHSQCLPTSPQHLFPPTYYRKRLLSAPSLDSYFFLKVNLVCFLLGPTNAMNFNASAFINSMRATSWLRRCLSTHMVHFSERREQCLASRCFCWIPFSLSTACWALLT